MPAHPLAAPELGLAEPVASINAFIDAELNRLESIAPQASPSSESIGRLNELLHATLKEG